MTETKQEAEPQRSSRFRKVVAGSSLYAKLSRMIGLLVLGMPALFPCEIRAGDADPTLYIIDGFTHATGNAFISGSVGRDILKHLKDKPWWKVSIGGSSAAMNNLMEKQPEQWRELAVYMTPQGGNRVQLMDGGKWPVYMFILSGETVIRNFEYGLQELAQAFPGEKIDSYGNQEPFFCSALPDILCSFGYKRAMLKNNTALWGFVERTVDADLILWEGSGGSVLPAIPVYKCEDLDSAGYPGLESVKRANANYARKCVAAGIKHPVGVSIKDGWEHNPRGIQPAAWMFGADKPNNKSVTLREYIEQIAVPPTQRLRLTAEDIRATLVWGAAPLSKHLAHCHVMEAALSRAGSLGLMAHCWAKTPVPEEALRAVENMSLDAYFYQGFTMPHPWPGNIKSDWIAERTPILVVQAIEKSKQLIYSATAALETAKADSDAGTWIRVFNTQAAERTEYVRAKAPAAVCRVLDAEGGEVPSQASGTEVIFSARVPSMGYATFRLESATPKSLTGARVLQADRPLTPGSADLTVPVVLESDCYRITLDPKQGMGIVSLYDQQLKREIRDTKSDRLINEFYGYSLIRNRFCSSKENPATKVEILEAGPLRLRVSAQGSIDGFPYTTTVSVEQGSRRIDFDTAFEFSKAEFGAPLESATTDDKNITWKLMRSWYDGSFKLQVLFPASIDRPALDKDAAFDVCRSRLQTTLYKKWDDLQCTHCLNWLDLRDEPGDWGLGVLCDRASGYVLDSNHVPGLILACGRNWQQYTKKIHDFAWSPLNGTHAFSYALLPHAGRWDKAGLWQASKNRHDPLQVQALSGKPSGARPSNSLLQIGTPGVTLSSLRPKGGDCYLRLFNASPEEQTASLKVDFAFERAELVELDNRVVAPVEATPEGSGKSLSIRLPHLGFRTIRFVGACKEK